MGRKAERTERKFHCFAGLNNVVNASLSSFGLSFGLKASKL